MEFKNSKITVVSPAKINLHLEVLGKRKDGYHELLSHGIKILGVSADSVKSHDKFASKFSLPFPLLSDESKEVINLFGVWGPKKFMGREYDGIHRITFVMNENNEVTHVVRKPKTKDHANEILKLLDLK